MGELIRVEPWRNIYHFSQTKTALNTKPSINNSWYMIHDGDALNAFFCRARLNTFTRLPKPDHFKLKAFADDKINVTQKLKFVMEGVEKIVKKEENAGYQHFLLFAQCFQKLTILWPLNVGIVF